VTRFSLVRDFISDKPTTCRVTRFSLVRDFISDKPTTCPCHKASVPLVCACVPACDPVPVSLPVTLCPCHKASVPPSARPGGRGAGAGTGGGGWAAGTGGGGGGWAAGYMQSSSSRGMSASWPSIEVAARRAMGLRMSALSSRVSPTNVIQER